MLPMRQTQSSLPDNEHVQPEVRAAKEVGANTEIPELYTVPNLTFPTLHDSAWISESKIETNPVRWAVFWTAE